MNNKSMADYSTVPEYYTKNVLDYSGSKYNVECIDVSMQCVLIQMVLKVFVLVI